MNIGILNKKIYGERWFVWTIAILISSGLTLWGYIEYTIQQVSNEWLEHYAVSLPLRRESKLTAGWQIYNNASYQFSLKVPDGVYFRVKEEPPGFAGQLSGLSFEFRSKKSFAENYFPLFSLLIFPADYYYELDETTPALARNDKYIFASSFSKDAPENLLPVLETLRLLLRSTFKFTKN